MKIEKISLKQVALRLRNRGFIGDSPRCSALRLEGDDDNNGRSCDLWLYVQKGKHVFPENYTMTTGWQGLVFNHRRPIPAGSLIVYSCNYCRNSFGRPVSLDGRFCAAVFTPSEHEHNIKDLLSIMRLSEEDPQSQYLLEALGF